ncbi:TetR/AcrR family transcriptional regulator [Paraconexibacter antarcticus]|uniref:TetR/AcrR family transcriptional regulator n=1 Tax=Paraconexibacter antarcticus TaxID=2949664 RepID=A0ABY5DT70_9ACTN|nr:TetR/AcrR family transcriptional regulator [Paraconexibacter antarcticus]UTI65223.1 TetR/AcrR family transcriptional regulator [Paraconexibacter antarcticus]
MTAPPARRTQEERTAETRGRLLDATIQSVLDVGYAATTTRRVTELAGVSQGAQTHHFPYRVDLVGAAIERLADQQIAEIAAHARELPTDPETRSGALLDLLWEHFSSPMFTIFVKLWIAAADDEDLHRRLLPVEKEMRRQVLAHAADIGGDLIAVPGWESRLNLVLTAMRGLALTEAFEPREQPPARSPWPAMRAELERMLRSAAP